MRIAAVQGFNCGDQFYSYLKDSFDVLYAEGRHTPAASVGLHCRLSGGPGACVAGAVCEIFLTSAGLGDATDRYRTALQKAAPRPECPN